MFSRPYKKPKDKEKEEVIRVRVTIFGKIKGNSYFEHIKERAAKFEIKGYIRRLVGAKFEAIYEGTPDNVEEMIKASKISSFTCNITNVEVAKVVTYELLDGFKVRASM